VNWASLFDQLSVGILALVNDPGRVVMIIVGGVLIYLAIAKDYEPTLLIPIGVGCILANIAGSGMGVLAIRGIPWATPPDASAEGLFNVLYNAGINNELFPLIIFIGIGAMTDFGPLLESPQMALLGAAGQFGIFGTLLIATLAGFDIRESASIGIIGSADGPTSIYVATVLAPRLLPATNDQSAAPHPHALHVRVGIRITCDPHPVSYRGHPRHLDPGSSGDAPDLDADVRKPAARVACGRPLV